VSEVRKVFSRHGASLGEAGSSVYIFQNREQPLYEVELDGVGEDAVLRLMADLDDLDDVQEVYSNLK